MNDPMKQVSKDRAEKKQKGATVREDMKKSEQDAKGNV